MATPFQKIKPKLALLLVLAVIAAFLFIAYYYWKQIQKNEPVSDKKTIEGLVPFSTSTPSSITQIPGNQLPKAFPPGIPLEGKDGHVLQNYSQKVGNEEQFTRQFTSPKSLEENFVIYQKYLKDRNWTIISSINNEAELKSFSAKHDQLGTRLIITLSHNKQTNNNIVDITYLMRVK